ncbi:alpha/beta fold hydrolase [Hymenobacter fastidiosus]|uniref:Alpha/beta fold hydrolase n=1 Tax=Hymenobacter fastidiosus TaxID=486264 RepID=A0ABP7RBC9_9BACT
MNNFLAGCFGAWLLLLGLPLLVVAQTQLPAKTSLQGQWKGALTVPGGSLPIVISVTELAGGNRFATLDVPMQRIVRSPMEVQQRGDTLIFDAKEVGCQLVCQRSTNGQQLQGTWQQPGYTTPVTLTFFVAPAVDPKNFKFPPPYRIEEVTVSNPVDNTLLMGTLTIPAGAGPFPAVLLLTDIGSQDRDATLGSYRMFGELADYLTRQGTAVLRLDDRGTGQSGGDNASTTTASLVKDAQAGLNFLRTRPLVDFNHLGLIGHGEGGNVALLTAAQPLPPAFVVTLAASGVIGSEQLMLRQTEMRRSSASDTTRGSISVAQQQFQADVRRQADKMRAEGANSAQVETFLDQQRMRQRSEEKKQLEVIMKQQRAMLEIIRQTTNDGQAQAIVANMQQQFTPGLDKTAALASAAQMTTPWYRYFLEFNPQTDLLKVQCPVLLLNGTADPEVGLNNLTLLEKGLRVNKRVTTRKLVGVNHQFQAPESEWPLVAGQPKPVFSPAAQEAIRDFVRQQLPNQVQASGK